MVGVEAIGSEVWCQEGFGARWVDDGLEGVGVAGGDRGRVEESQRPGVGEGAPNVSRGLHVERMTRSDNTGQTMTRRNEICRRVKS